MASITIRNLDDTIKMRLRIRAAQHGWSMEQEVREILQQSLLSEESAAGFAQRIHRRFADLGFDELQIPARRVVRHPPDLEVHGRKREIKEQ